jgi:riboflavin kinase
MSVLVLGYIRPELDYISKGELCPSHSLSVGQLWTDEAEALIDDINTDVKVALNCLARPSYACLASDPRLTGKLIPH